MIRENELSLNVSHAVGLRTVKDPPLILVKPKILKYTDIEKVLEEVRHEFEEHLHAFWKMCVKVESIVGLHNQRKKKSCEQRILFPLFPFCVELVCVFTETE